MTRFELILALLTVLADEKARGLVAQLTITKSPSGAWHMALNTTDKDTKTTEGT